MRIHSLTLKLIIRAKISRTTVFEDYEVPVITGKPQDEHCLFPCDDLSLQSQTNQGMNELMIFIHIYLYLYFHIKIVIAISVSS